MCLTTLGSRLNKPEPASAAEKCEETNTWVHGGLRAVGIMTHGFWIEWGIPSGGRRSTLKVCEEVNKGYRKRQWGGHNHGKKLSHQEEENWASYRPAHSCQLKERWRHYRTMKLTSQEPPGADALHKRFHWGRHSPLPQSTGVKVLADWVTAESSSHRILGRRMHSACNSTEAAAQLQSDCKHQQHEPGTWESQWSPTRRNCHFS